MEYYTVKRSKCKKIMIIANVSAKTKTCLKYNFSTDTLNSILTP